MISICIPSLNGGEEFGAHLRAWIGQEVSEDLEVVVLDSESEDGTVERARGAGAAVYSIQRAQFNHGTSRNFLAERARGDVLMFTVQDAYPASPHTVRELVEPLRKDPDLSGVTGKQVPRSDANIIARWETDYHANAFDKGLRKKRLPTPEEFDRLELGQKVEIIAFDNVCSAMRRSVWERFPFPAVNFGEDLHWSFNVLRAGHTLLHNPAARVHHSHNRSSWLRLKRHFVTRRTLSWLFDLPPAGFPWSEAQAFQALTRFRGGVAKLRNKIGQQRGRLRRPGRLKSPWTGLYLCIRGMEKWGPRALRPTACQLLSLYPVEYLHRHFNYVLNQVFTYHGSLDPAGSLMVVEHAEAQVVGDFLAQAYYRCERLHSLSEEFRGLGALLQRYY